MEATTDSGIDPEEFRSELLWIVNSIASKIDPPIGYSNPNAVANAIKVCISEYLEMTKNNIEVLPVFNYDALNGVDYKGMNILLSDAVFDVIGNSCRILLISSQIGKTQLGRIRLGTLGM